MIKEMTEKNKGRKLSLNQIYFYLTEGCNLYCRHCWLAPKYQSGSNSYPSLSLKLFQSIIRQAKPLGLSQVKLTGGEPLLHPQISEILDEIQANELRLVVETNGLLCTEDLARKMAACKNPFVSVSLDAVDAETHEWLRRMKGCFEQAKEGIGNLVKAGFKPQIIMTMARRNKEQIETMVRFAESLGCGSVKFNILQPTSRGEEMHQAGETLTIEELVEIGGWVENILSSSTNLRLHYSHPLAFRPLSRMFGEDGYGCSVCAIFNILGVLADGSYALCGIGEIVPELIFGHAAGDRLKDVWKDNPVLGNLREGLPERLKGICQECLMKDRCLGQCIAHNYYSTKSLWAPYWFCDQANKQGLFPETRRKEKIEVEQRKD